MQVEICNELCCYGCGTLDNLETKMVARLDMSEHDSTLEAVYLCKECLLRVANMIDEYEARKQVEADQEELDFIDKDEGGVS